MPANAQRDGAPELGEKSDEESAAPGASGAGQGKTQRSAKACDRCRKSKSKCEPSPTDGEPCKSCAAIGAECAYTAPSFRRGPPKGYIQALEHRLHQVESVLAAIMTSTDTRSRSIVDELGKDELASHIIDTVDAGPFGRTGREKRAFDTTKDNFFSSIVAEKPKAQSHRSRRESRATREHVIENVIARDPMIQTTRPTLLWQDRLSERLGRSFGSGSFSPQPVPSPPSITESSSREDPYTSEPPRTKRRIEERPARSVHMSAPYVGGSRMPSQEAPEGDEDLFDCADAFGNLSINENREVRYHGNASGLQLLAQSERTDGRNIQGIWNFPMARFWPGPPNDGRQFIDESIISIENKIRMPAVHIQDRLVQVYFTYINPAVPVVDEESFMAQYQAMKLGYSEDSNQPPGPPSSEVRPERPQKISKLLLFAMFAYAASHLDPLNIHDAAVDAARAGDYATVARRILDTMYHESRSSTVQALILLGIREFGIGSLEEGWLHIGMAVRMALDLGLNRNPDKWTHSGRELFSPKEKEIRKRIWWACCLADKFSALFLGRTISIHEGDFSTPLLDIPPDDMDHMWQPCPPDPRYGTIAPVPAVHFGYLRHISALYVITGEVLAKVYRVSRAHTVPPRAIRQELYSRLLQWALELPEHLQYNPTASSRPCPAPHVLIMHVQYWATVLLLHRPFIPKGTELARAGSPSLENDPIPWESYDICQGAASQLASFAMLYHEKYDMRWAPPFAANCLQAAGIMQIVTLKYKPLDTQASVGLQKCISALVGMEATWASGLRVRHLIQGAKVNVDRAYESSARASDARQKRPAQAAFELDSAYASRFPSTSHTPVPSVPSYAPPPMPPPQHSIPPRFVPSQPAHSEHPQYAYPGYRTHPQGSPPRDVATPAAMPLPAYMPGYDSWWPVVDNETDVSAGVGQCPEVAQMHGGGAGTSDGVVHGGVAMPQGDFTFDQQHFSPEFLQAMRDPMLHFPSAFSHIY
ncbi:uncharacterized protein TRAVEDRAFT_160349 [Trametes versicolor FP-101664 SS1]|uniref:uncharacterized protein n=1 Tax=Trametes versicolor (strain FP-101664) TaxID=717944 RepID=UPI00046223BF|nr:uncharacterized protein TRAVEDRAFT_160349 [Trametes versicolor FP-101664 SS1]EIW62469.1 hypothetical protein TRAVEDRAFT_160349 [Trametes versicolor FP-101664 SS1]